MKAIRPNT